MRQRPGGPQVAEPAGAAPRRSKTRSACGRGSGASWRCPNCSTGEHAFSRPLAGAGVDRLRVVSTSGAPSARSAWDQGGTNGPFDPDVRSPPHLVGGVRVASVAGGSKGRGVVGRKESLGQPTPFSAKVEGVRKGGGESSGVQLELGRASSRSPRKGPRRQTKVLENLAGDGGREDARQDATRPAALVARQDVCGEGSLEELGPWDAVLGGRSRGPEGPNQIAERRQQLRCGASECRVFAALLRWKVKRARTKRLRGCGVFSWYLPPVGTGAPCAHLRGEEEHPATSRNRRKQAKLLGFICGMSCGMWPERSRYIPQNTALRTFGT
jgi:hypothetical protein